MRNSSVRGSGIVPTEFILSKRVAYGVFADANMRGTSCSRKTEVEVGIDGEAEETGVGGMGERRFPESCDAEAPEALEVLPLSLEPEYGGTMMDVK